MVGERIKALREKNKYTQSDLAKKMHLSRSAINAWEMGISVPSTQCLVELSSMFNVSTDFILGISKDEIIDISYLNNEEKEMIYALLKHFKKYHNTLETLYNSGLAPADKENDN